MLQLHRIYVIGVVTHPTEGVMIFNDQIASGSFTFCGCEVHPGEDWRNPLFFAIKQKTWLEDLSFSKILWAQSFPAHVIAKEPTFAFFVHVETSKKGHQHGYRWVKSLENLHSLALFHPLVASLCEDALNDHSSLASK